MTDEGIGRTIISCHAPETITRRSFIKGSTVLGAASVLGGSVVGWMQKLAFAEGKVDLAAVKGADYFQSTIKAVEILGGMGKFVSKQAKVGLLINSPWEHPGSFVRPEITLAVILMCRDAGAKEIGIFVSLGDSYWQRSALSEKFRDEVESIRSLEGGYKEVPVPGGRAFKKAEIAKGLLKCDVFINIPIAKDHTGVRFTGTMKNMMSETSRSTNRFFHSGSGARGYYDDVEHLSQCIADVNLVRKMNFHAGHCNFECTICMNVCPSGAMLPLALENKKLTQLGGACSEHCPTKAVDMVPYPNPVNKQLKIPEMKPEYCIGCGGCEHTSGTTVDQ